MNIQHSSNDTSPITLLKKPTSQGTTPSQCQTLSFLIMYQVGTRHLKPLRGLHLLRLSPVPQHFVTLSTTFSSLLSSFPGDIHKARYRYSAHSSFISFQIWSPSDSMISLSCHSRRTSEIGVDSSCSLIISPRRSIQLQEPPHFPSAGLTSKPPDQTTRSLNSGSDVPSSSQISSKIFHPLPFQVRL